MSKITKVKSMSVIDSFKHVKEKVIRNRYSYLCIVVSDGIDNYGYPLETEIVLKEALLNIDDDLWETTVPYEIGRTKMKTVENNYAFWNGYDIETRVKFLDRLIEKLEKDER